MEVCDFSVPFCLDDCALMINYVLPNLSSFDPSFDVFFPAVNLACYFKTLGFKGKFLCVKDIQFKNR